jgi:hypothetical protein
LLDFFELNQGDVTMVLESIPYSTNADIDRFNEFYLTRLADFDPSYTLTFKITCRRIKPYEEELTKLEAEQNISSLAHLIQSKNKDRGNDMMAGLMARYGGGDLMIDYDPLSDPNYGQKTQLKKGKGKGKKGKRGRKGGRKIK